MKVHKLSRYIGLAAPFDAIVCGASSEYDSEDERSSRKWKHVTCKRCLARRRK